MKIFRTSQLTGIKHEREVNVQPEQIYAWQNGKKIQDAMPDVPPEEREFIMTGITPEEWDAAFKDEE